jgi:hypothetical protein
MPLRSIPAFRYHDEIAGYQLTSALHGGSPDAFRSRNGDMLDDQGKGIIKTFMTFVCIGGAPRFRG